RFIRVKGVSSKMEESRKTESHFNKYAPTCCGKTTSEWSQMGVELRGGEVKGPLIKPIAICR
ncbi:hypothetical protein ACR2V4_27260, partial [Klebsiella pneumoniae]